MKRKPYAIIMLDTLNVRMFEHKDEWEAARRTLIGNHAKFVVAKWQHSAGHYVMPETADEKCGHDSPLGDLLGSCYDSVDIYYGKNSDN